MNDIEIYAKLTSIFQDIFDDEVVLAPETTADDVDQWDSLNHVRLILAVSKAFDVKFSASSIGDLKNVGGLVTLIRDTLNRKG